MRKLIIVFFGFLCFRAFSQQPTIPIGAWQTHLAYTNGLMAQQVGNLIYCVTNNGFFTWNKEYGSAEGLSKIQGFYSPFATTIGYNPANNVMLIAYQDGTIDKVVGNAINKTPIKDLTVGLTSFNVRTINNFYFHGDFCYISTANGIWQYDVVHANVGVVGHYGITELGTNITGVTILSDSNGVDTAIYASSNTGIWYSHLNNTNIQLQLFNSNSWQQITIDSCLGLVTFNNHVYANFKDSVSGYFGGNKWKAIKIFSGMGLNVTSIVVNYGNLVIASNKNIMVLNNSLVPTIYNTNANFAILDNDEKTVWTCNLAYALESVTLQNGVTSIDFFHTPNAPNSYSCQELYNNKGNIYAAGGGVTTSNSPDYSQAGFYIYSNNSWTNYNNTNQSWMSNPILSANRFLDIMSVKVDPITNHVWAGVLDGTGLNGGSGGGLIEFNNGQVLNVYSSNATVTSVSDIVFDSIGNLWMTDRDVIAGAPTIRVKTPAGQWYSFLCFNTDPTLGSILIDIYGQVWVIDPRGGSIDVLKPPANFANYNRNTNLINLGTAKGHGNLPSSSVNCFVSDKTGEIWVGTNLGLTIFYDPSCIFSGSNCDAQQPWYQNGKQSGYLFNDEAVTAIAVDAGNRKWVATGSGVSLVSPDGSQILQTFNTANSPLFSNNVKSIAINGQTGEVFFATDMGIISYRSTALDDNLVDNRLYSYPNPVRPGYTGPIAIRGLPDDADVRIVDVNGNLVYQTTALGSQATWDGKTFSGRAVSSGVYVVFATSQDNTQTVTTKIVIVR